jgi:hypothetical protein
MKLSRFRAPALAAGAVLMISGAGIAFAQSPSTAAPLATAPTVQSEPIEAVGADTDTLQQGDQTTPDVPGAGVTGSTVSTVKSAPRVISVAAAPAAAAPAEPTTPETGAETPETGTGTEAASDGPGGHADPAGQNVDHQFDGEE